jgi:hypothetical protein
MFGISGLMLFSIRAAVADSWAPPSESWTFSQNGKFLAHDIPGNKSSSPLAIVLSISNQRTNEMWRTRLVNDVSPSQIFLSDDGNSVVTLDNWGGIGYGDDVVAIYGPKGLLAKYSLEQFAPPPKGNSNSLDFVSRDGYGGLFSHSTSSRHWRENSIQFFYSDKNEELFCLWLDWDNRWVAWRLDTGSIIKVVAELARRLNTEGRRRSLIDSQSPHASAAAMNFLGRTRMKQDRSIIEAWLHDTKFFSGSLTISSSRATEFYFAFTSRSDKRETADKILSRWDGLDSDVTELGSREDYRFLGTLKCSVTLPVSPQRKEGVIRLYLIPFAVPLNRWSEQRPEHYLVADLSDSFPHDFRNGQIDDHELGTRPNFIIYGITAGEYRLKALWSKTPSPTIPAEVLAKPQPGDYESMESPLVSIGKGRLTEGIQVDCTKLIGH